MNLKVDYSPTERVSTFFRGGYFSEERVNAKYSTFDGSPEVNDTMWKSVERRRAGGAARPERPAGAVFPDSKRFNSNFLAVPRPA